MRRHAVEAAIDLSFLVPWLFLSNLAISESDLAISESDLARSESDLTSSE